MNVVQLVQPEEQVSFDDFWLIYPRREAKKDAKKAWAKLTEAQQMDALVALVDWRKVFLARDSERYIPLAASWLNGERWEDELPREFKGTNPYPSAEQTRAASAGRTAERAPMPDKLRQLLASLKK